jgi:hypothetical protein
MRKSKRKKWMSTSKERIMRRKNVSNFLILDRIFYKKLKSKGVKPCKEKNKF